MAEIIIMPKLGLGMSFGIVTSIHVKEDDMVKEGDVLLEFETNKLAEEVTSPIDGYVLKVCVEEEEEVPICSPMIVIGQKGESFTLEEVVEETEEASAETVPEPEVSVSEKAAPVSPIAKKLAAELGVDLKNVVGTGEGGRIMREDILKCAQEQTAAPTAEPNADTEGVVLSAMRKTIAAHMEQSKQEIPHVYLKTVANVTALMSWKKELAKWTEQKITFNDIMVKLAAVAMEKVPELNASLRDGKLVSYKDVNIGIAVNNSKGLLVPVVHEANHKNLEEIAQTTKELIGKAKESKLAPQDMEGGTFTISNLGGAGIREFYAIINAPEAAILAVGEVYETPIVQNGEVTVGKEVTLCLSADHRIIDGIVGAKYLAVLKNLIERPYDFLL